MYGVLLFIFTFVRFWLNNLFYQFWWRNFIFEYLLSHFNQFKFVSVLVNSWKPCEAGDLLPQYLKFAKIYSFTNFVKEPKFFKMYCRLALTILVDWNTKMWFFHSNNTSLVGNCMEFQHLFPLQFLFGKITCFTNFGWRATFLKFCNLSFFENFEQFKYVNVLKNSWKLCEDCLFCHNSSVL